MALVRVYGHTYLNPACVGKVVFTPKFNDGESRTNTTLAYDVTGVELLCVETTVPTPAPRNDPHAVKRDNHAHAEIVKALHEVHDAKDYQEE